MQLLILWELTTDRSLMKSIYKARENTQPDVHPVYNLSEREVEITKLIVNGLTSSEITDKLFIYFGAY